MTHEPAGNPLLGGMRRKKVAEVTFLIMPHLPAHRRGTPEAQHPASPWGKSGTQLQTTLSCREAGDELLEHLLGLGPQRGKFHPELPAP